MIAPSSYSSIPKLRDLEWREERGERKHSGKRGRNPGRRSNRTYRDVFCTLQHMIRLLPLLRLICELDRVMARFVEKAESNGILKGIASSTLTLTFFYMVTRKMFLFSQVKNSCPLPERRKKLKTLRPFFFPPSLFFIRCDAHFMGCGPRANLPPPPPAFLPGQQKRMAFSLFSGTRALPAPSSQKYGMDSIFCPRETQKLGSFPPKKE